MCGGKGTNCMTKGVVYEAVCDWCKTEDATYIGETARQIGIRASEHSKNADLLKLNSFVVDHWMEKHPISTVPPIFKFKTLSKHGDALSRQVREAVTIMARGKLNKKNEFGINEIIRLEPSRYEWQQEKERKTTLTNELEREAKLKNFISVMAVVQNIDIKRNKNIVVNLQGSNYSRKHFSKRKEREMEGQFSGMVSSSKKARGPNCSTPLSYRSHHDQKNSSDCSTFSSPGLEGNNSSDHDVEVTCANGKTELSWETSNVEIDDMKAPAPLFETLANQAVMMSSFSDAEKNFTSSRVGGEMIRYANEVDWNADIKFKKNESDNNSYDQFDILNEYDYYCLDWLFNSSSESCEEKNNTEPLSTNGGVEHLPGTSKNIIRSCVNVDEEQEDFGLQLLFDQGNVEVDEQHEDFGLQLLFDQDNNCFNEEEIDGRALDERINQLKKNKLYGIFLKENLASFPKRKRSPDQETTAKFRRMTIADGCSPSLKRHVRSGRNRAMSVAGVSATPGRKVNKKIVLEPKQSLLTQFWESERN